MRMLSAAIVKKEEDTENKREKTERKIRDESSRKIKIQFRIISLDREIFF